MLRHTLLVLFGAVLLTWEARDPRYTVQLQQRVVGAEPTMLTPRHGDTGTYTAPDVPRGNYRYRIRYRTPQRSAWSDWSAVVRVRE